MPKYNNEKSKYALTLLLYCNSCCPSIRDRVLCKRGLDGDNSCLKFIFFFPSIKKTFILFYFMQIFSADAKIFLKKISEFFLTPET